MSAVTVVCVVLICLVWRRVTVRFASCTLVIGLWVHDVSVFLVLFRPRCVLLTVVRVWESPGPTVSVRLKGVSVVLK